MYSGNVHLLSEMTCLLLVLFFLHLPGRVDARDSNVTEEVEVCPICPEVPGDACPWGLVKLYLYNQYNHPECFELDMSDLANAPWEYTLPATLVILTHGFTQDCKSSNMSELMPALAADGMNEVVCLDWGVLCGFPCYLQAVKNMDAVAHCVCDFIEAYRTVKGVKDCLPHTHVMGHSLGAHVAIKASYLCEAHRVTCFDPAGPCIKSQKANASCFADVYHSNCGFFGTGECLGDIDIFLNNAVYQPGCGCNIGRSHIISIDYYLESLLHGKPIRCLQATEGNCKRMADGESPEICYSSPPRVLDVGHHINYNLSGSCVAFTNSDPPYLKEKSFYDVCGWEAYCRYCPYLNHLNECLISPAIDWFQFGDIDCFNDWCD